MARSHILLRFATEMAPPQLIRITKHKNTPARSLDTIVEEDMDVVEFFCSSVANEKSASGNRLRSRRLGNSMYRSVGF